jgi:hypothetical protein
MIAIYIDVQNTHMRTLEQGRTIDWEKFLIYLKENMCADKIYYAVGKRKEFDLYYIHLETLWYTMLYKKTLILPNGEIKGNVDIDIAIQSVIDSYDKDLQQAYLITNDGDYNSLVDFFKSKNIFWGLITGNFQTAGRLLRKSAGKDIWDIQRIRHLIEKKALAD